MRASGSLAKRAGINKQTIRYYERIGLIKSTLRNDSGYKFYADDVLERLSFIQRSKYLGFKLTEIAELLNLKVEEKGNCSLVKKKAQQKLEEIQEKIQLLRSMQSTLESLIKACAKKKPTGACPILASLNSGEKNENRTNI